VLHSAMYFFVYQYASVSYKNTYAYCPVDPES